MMKCRDFRLKVYNNTHDVDVGHKVPEESRGNGESPDEVLPILPVVQVDELAHTRDVLAGRDLWHQRDEGQRGQGQEEGQTGQETEAPDELELNRI